MAANELTWDGGTDPLGNPIGAYRPGVADFDGDGLEDDQEFPPNAGEDPTAGGWNQLVKQATALARVATPARITVTFSSGTPIITGLRAAGTKVKATTFTVTDMGTGVTKIEIPAGTFPARVTAPTALTLAYVAAPSGAHWGDIEVISTGVVVRTYSGTTPADLAFTFDWE